MKLSRIIYLIAVVIIVAWLLSIVFKIAAWLISGLIYVAAIVVIIGLISQWLESRKKTNTK